MLVDDEEYMVYDFLYGFLDRDDDVFAGGIMMMIGEVNEGIIYIINESTAAYIHIYIHTDRSMMVYIGNCISFVLRYGDDLN